MSIPFSFDLSSVTEVKKYKMCHRIDRKQDIVKKESSTATQHAMIHYVYPILFPSAACTNRPSPARAPLVTSTADIELATTGNGRPFKDLTPENKIKNPLNCSNVFFSRS